MSSKSTSLTTPCPSTSSLNPSEYLCVLHKRTTLLSSRASNLLRASSQWCHTVSSTQCLGAWTSAQLNAHPSIECKCTAPQIETPFVPAAQQLTAQQLIIWRQQHTCGALGGSPVECGVGGQPYKIPHFHPRHRHPPSRMTLPIRAYVRLNRLHASVGRFRSCLYKWRYGPFCGLWVWRRRTNRGPCCPSTSNLSTSSWTARPDGSWRWDSQIAAQHLPRELVRPSSG